mmetsp:Transcript_555/g.1030  ORF Transcript_555/g.1030 Transcript_555/m.1030 type:complete len:97 (-) Transcript_555:1135-1425(-)
MRWLLSPLATARSTPEEYHVTQHVKSALICSQRGATQPIENRHGLNAATRLVTCHHFRLIAVKEGLDAAHEHFMQRASSRNCASHAHHPHVVQQSS